MVTIAIWLWTWWILWLRVWSAPVLDLDRPGMFSPDGHGLVPYRLLMRRSSLATFLLFAGLILWLLFPQVVNAQDSTPSPNLLTMAPAGSETSSSIHQPSDGISEPKDGAVLGGEVVVSGTANYSWILAFTYADKPTATWFQLTQSDKPVSNGTLAKWDTRNLTDGMYLIKLSVQTPGKSQDYIIKIRVSNELATPTGTPTRFPTSTPSPIPSATALHVTGTATGNLALSSTASEFQTIAMTQTNESVMTVAQIISSQSVLLPMRNPASVDPNEIVFLLAKSFIIVSVVFSLTGLILFIRKK